mmetsp:Transcript_108081/g.182848  ORF Transcript_108081/g.182848 Transcript_108081/m.182848 type:complete len:91 (+) Transcript_108081:125-397(+)
MACAEHSAVAVTFPGGACSERISGWRGVWLCRLNGCWVLVRGLEGGQHVGGVGPDILVGSSSGPCLSVQTSAKQQEQNKRSAEVVSAPFE